MSRHLNLQPFDCSMCKEKFKRKHHLIEHRKTHTGLNPYKCGICAKKFMWQGSFMCHLGHCEAGEGPGLGPSLGEGWDLGAALWASLAAQERVPCLGQQQGGEWGHAHLQPSGLVASICPQGGDGLHGVRGEK